MGPMRLVGLCLRLLKMLGIRGLKGGYKTAQSFFLNVEQYGGRWEGDRPKDNPNQPDATSDEAMLKGWQAAQGMSTDPLRQQLRDLPDTAVAARAALRRQPLTCNRI
jgi:hypothetical protein